MNRFAIRIGAVAIALGVLSGCGAGARTPVYPVRGQVTFNNQPIANALVTFHQQDVAPAAATPRSILTENDGSFEMTTYAKGDGLPAGKYAVTVTWFQRPPGAKVDGEEDTVRINQLPARYARPETSRLEAIVERHANELLPFQLTR